MHGHSAEQYHQGRGTGDHAARDTQREQLPQRHRLSWQVVAMVSGRRRMAVSRHVGRRMVRGVAIGLCNGMMIMSVGVQPSRAGIAVPAQIASQSGYRWSREHPK